jgi:hypothetical protein
MLLTRTPRHVVSAPSSVIGMSSEALRDIALAGGVAAPEQLSCVSAHGSTNVARTTLSPLESGKGLQEVVPTGLCPISILIRQRHLSSRLNVFNVPRYRKPARRLPDPRSPSRR